MITFAFIVLLLNMFYASLLNGYRKQWKMIRKTKKVEYDVLPNVTLIVPFRNEKKNLTQLISCINSIKYPSEKLQLIFVDDHSDDESSTIVSAAEIKFSTSVILSNGTGKKAALTTGIELANAEWIVTIDADVIFEPEWLHKLFSVPQLTTTEMICGLVLVRSENRNAGILEQFQEMEFDMLQASGIAALSSHQPLLNSGANLAFKKSAWKEVGGYSSNANISSGDDTFLMFALHEQYGNVIQGNVEAQVKTNVAESWKSFIQQRQRWAAKGRYYKNKYVQTTGAIVVLSSLFIPVFYFFTDIPEIAMTLITTLVLRAFTEVRLVKAFEKTVGKRHAAFALLWMSLVYPFFLLFMTILAPFNKSQWKGRKL